MIEHDGPGGTDTADAYRVGVLAIIMQRAFIRVRLWCDGERRKGAIPNMRNSPSWEEFDVAQTAFKIAVEEAAESVAKIQIGMVGETAVRKERMN